MKEKAGLKYEARLRQNRRNEEGWDDTLIYSLLEHEWREVAALGTRTRQLSKPDQSPRE